MTKLSSHFLRHSIDFKPGRLGKTISKSSPKPKFNQKWKQVFLHFCQCCHQKLILLSLYQYSSQWWSTDHHQSWTWLLSLLQNKQAGEILNLMAIWWTHEHSNIPVLKTKITNCNCTERHAFYIFICLPQKNHT